MKKVFAFGLDLEVEDWVKYLAVDDDGEIFGFSIKPWVINQSYWGVDTKGGAIRLGKLAEIVDFELMIVGV